jgi:hypothetical protein
MQQAEIEVAGAKAKSEMHKLGKDHSPKSTMRLLIFY